MAWTKDWLYYSLAKEAPVRKLKAPDQKAKSLTITTPFSKVKTDIGASAVYNRAMARLILGKELEDFEAVYKNPLTDTRYKRDAIPQEYIRCARWMVEGTITGVWGSSADGGCNPGIPQGLLCRVLWRVTNTDHYVLINMATKQFVRVLYDEAMTLQEGQAFIAEHGLKPATKWVSPLTANLKWSLFLRWLQVSTVAKELGIEVECD